MSCLARGCSNEEYFLPWQLCKKHGKLWAEMVLQESFKDAEEAVLTMANLYKKGKLKKEEIIDAYKTIVGWD